VQNKYTKREKKQKRERVWEFDDEQVGTHIWGWFTNHYMEAMLFFYFYIDPMFD
jgi:hypothetical protein